MSQLILTRSSYARRTLHAYPAFPLSLRVGKYFLLFAMTFLIGLISFLYLLKFTEIHTKGYQLRKLEIEKNSLMNAAESKNTEIARLKSLNSIRESASALHLVQAGKTTFIRQESGVAQTPVWGRP